MGCERASLKAYAKINLYLEVIGVHPSGKHLLQTVMHTVSLCDTVTVSRGEGITLRCAGGFEVPEDRRNIAYRCAEVFFRETGIGGGAAIEIEKRIPTGAGLGGGSADGAAVLRGLNMIYGCGLSREELCGIGAACGADIPFCVVGGCGHCTGFGEIIEPLPVLSGCVVIAKGKEGISTAEAYGRINGLLGDGIFGGGGVAKSNDISRGGFREDIKETFGRGGRVAEAAGECYNIFEAVTDNADVDRIKAVMTEAGAAAAMMTGSGSAVFGIFEDVTETEEALKVLKSNGFWCEVHKLAGEIS